MNDRIIKSRGSKIADWVIAFVCLLLILVFILPVINILARSLSSPDALIKNAVSLWPVGFNFDAYIKTLQKPDNSFALVWTAGLTIGCTILSMFMTTICAYPLIYSKLKGRRVINVMILITMYFNPGIVPTYLLFRTLGIINTPVVLIVPFCLSAFNMIIMRSYFYGIPDSLRESAEIDGANPIKILVRIYLPLSLPVIATLSLFYAVGRWNGWSDALIYMNGLAAKKWRPLQYLLYLIIQGTVAVDVQPGEAVAVGFAENLKMAFVMFATVPILLVYPWLQKYFIAGATLGAVKE